MHTCREEPSGAPDAGTCETVYGRVQNTSTNRFTGTVPAVNNYRRLVLNGYGDIFRYIVLARSRRHHRVVVVRVRIDTARHIESRFQDGRATQPISNIRTCPCIRSPGVIIVYHRTIHGKILRALVYLAICAGDLFRHRYSIPHQSVIRVLCAHWSEDTRTSSSRLPHSARRTSDILCSSH